MADILNVVERKETGTKRNQRLRASGRVPAVLYGHGQESKPLSLDMKELEAVMRHSGHFVTLAGAVAESALIKDIQYDHYEQSVLHVDLYRVDMDEKVEVEVALTFKGTAVGTTQGGIMEVVMHEVTINCPAFAIPDKLIVKVADLGLHQEIRASQIELPKGAELVTSPDSLVVHCVPPAAEVEPTAAEAGPAEPELVGRKPEDGEEASE